MDKVKCRFYVYLCFLWIDLWYLLLCSLYYRNLRHFNTDTLTLFRSVMSVTVCSPRPEF